jgi:hypothetical protein
MRLADNELEVFHELLEQMESELAQERVYAANDQLLELEMQLAQELAYEVDDPKAAERRAAAQRRGARGEKAMANWFKSRPSWAFVGKPGGDVPSHPGPDGVAWRRNRKGGLEMLLLDNKATGQKYISRATGLGKESLLRNLGAILERMSTDPDQMKLKDVGAARKLLEQTWRNLVRGKNDEDGNPVLPPGVRRVVTNASGKSVGLSKDLARQDFDFFNLRKRLAMGRRPAKTARDDRLARWRQLAAAKAVAGQSELAGLGGPARLAGP